VKELTDDELHALIIEMSSKQINNNALPDIELVDEEL
jgi:hypothetical protein